MRTESSRRKEQMRTIEKMERESAQMSQLPAQLRVWAQRFEVPEAAFLQAAQGHPPELLQQVGDATVTWPVFQVLHDIAQSAAAEPVRPQETVVS